MLGAGVRRPRRGVPADRGRPRGRRLRALARARRPGGDARRRRGPPARALLPPPVLDRPPHRGAVRRAGDAGRARVAVLESSRTSRQGRQWPFVTPMDLLRFKPLPPLARVRLGAAVLAIQRGPGNPAPFERVTARAWIERYMGRDAWRALWGPLLRGKFGERADDIAMVWLQNKLRLRRGDDAAEEKLGYPKRSWEPLFDALRERDRGRRRARADRPPGGARRARASSSRRARPGSFRRGPRPARLRDAASPSATTPCWRRCPSDVFEQLARARPAAGGLPGQAARDRVLHRALPADRARPPVLAVLLDQHRRRRAAVRRPDRAHEPDRARSATAAAASSTWPTTSRAATSCSSSTPRRCSSATRRACGRSTRAFDTQLGQAACGCTASRPPSRS